MITVGEILRKAREKRKLTIEQVEKVIRVRAKFIEALEKNEFEKLPGPIYGRGFVKNYASFLGLNPEETLAFYRRQANPEQLQEVPREKRIFVVRGLRITPQLFTAVSVATLVALFFSYLAFSYLQFAGSPALSVSSPANNVVVSEENITVSGKTDPGAMLLINDQQVDISPEGSFNVTVPLAPGLNTITITATNKFGRKTVVSRNLRLEK
jgi:cytoskeletal protein RodZ